jgi:ATP-binding cassette, subfamily B, bacterial MsbA
MPNARPRRERPSRSVPSGLLGRFLEDWIRPHWRILLHALGLTGLLAAITGLYPMVIKYSFDSLIKGDLTPLPWILAAIVAATLIRAVLLYLHAVTANQIVLRMTTDIQKAAFKHLIDADYARLTRETPGRLVSRLTNDIQFIQQAAQSGLINSVRDGLSIIALAIAMIYLDWLMSLVVLGIYPLAILPIMALGRRLRRVAKQTQAQVGDMTSLLTEKLSGARLIKTYRLESYAAQRMHASFERILSLRMKAVRNRARLDPMLEALGGFAVAGVVAFAAWRIGTSGASFGDFMGFVTAMLMASQPVRALGNISTRVQEGLAAAERIYDLLDEPPKIVEAPGALPLIVTRGTVHFDKVSFSYEDAGGRKTLNDIDLVVPGGSTVALVGSSGSGKTTLLNLVPRLFDVDRGRILIDGQDIRDVTVSSLRAAIAMVSQDVVLFDDTIRANIALGRLGASDAEIVAAARAATAHDFILEQPHGYETEIGDRGLKLSGGQRQRLALARAILMDAPMLLLDEATSALDSESERLVQKALAEFSSGCTTLVVAHRLSTVRNADLICVMAHGRIIEWGTHAELVAAAGTYSQLLRMQFGEPGTTETEPPMTVEDDLRPSFVRGHF